MKEAIKKVVCDFVCGVGDGSCENCSSFAKNSCQRLVNKLLITIHKNKSKL